MRRPYRAERRGEADLRCRDYRGLILTASSLATIRLPYLHGLQAKWPGWHGLPGQAFPDGANVLQVRGLAGVSVDELIHSGVVAGASKRTWLKIVGSVNGNWSQTAAQKAVAGILPSLPKIDAVVTQGDDGFGVAQALPRRSTTAGYCLRQPRRRTVAVEEAKDANGYQAFSISSAPSISSLAFWVAQQLLDGKQMPHDLLSPAISVTPGHPRKLAGRVHKPSLTPPRQRHQCGSHVACRLVF